MYDFRSSAKLQVILAGAVSANQLPITAVYEDGSDGRVRAAARTVDTISNSGTAVDVFTGNSAGRRLKALAIHNADTASVTLTVRYYNPTGTTRILWKGALATLEGLHYDESRGWYTTDVNGAQKTTAATDASTADSKAESAATRASTALSAATSLDTATDTAYSTDDSTVLSKATSLDAAQSAEVSATLSKATSQDTAQSSEVSATLSKATSQDVAQSTAVSAVQSNEVRQSTDQSTMRSLLNSGGQAGF